MTFFFFLFTLLRGCISSGENPLQNEASTVSPFTVDVLPIVTQQYNAEVTGHRMWATRCLAYWELFQDASNITGYPTEYIAGVAMHESAGCDMNARDRAGGRGFMQITSRPSKTYRQRAADLLQINVKDLDYKQDPFHNLVMGTVFLADYEGQLLSRPHGLLAYNMGVGGVRKTVKHMGRSTKDLPSVVEMAPHLRYNPKMKPRVYVWKVLASVIMMDRVHRGLPLERVAKNFTTSDIPGWDPNDDPWR